MKRIIQFIKKPYILWPAVVVVLTGVHIYMKPGYADNHPDALVVDYNHPVTCDDGDVPIRSMKQALCAVARNPELSEKLHQVQQNSGYQGWRISPVATGRLIRLDQLTLKNHPYEWQVLVRSLSGIIPSYSCTVTVMPSGEAQAQCGYNK